MSNMKKLGSEAGQGLPEYAILLGTILLGAIATVNVLWGNYLKYWVAAHPQLVSGTIWLACVSVVAFVMRFLYTTVRGMKRSSTQGSGNGGFMMVDVMITIGIALIFVTGFPIMMAPSIKAGVSVVGPENVVFTGCYAFIATDIVAVTWLFLTRKPCARRSSY